jgi:transcriptional antiterminator RfaH
MNGAEIGAAWFCLQAQPKHEHIAAAHLRKMGDIRVFLPRVRFQRVTRQGTAWVTEALFPGYLFARFEWRASLRHVQSVPGIRNIVHFGDHWPSVPEAIIEQLRQSVGADELHTIPREFFAGDAIHVADGILRGLHAVVSRVMDGRERVAVLMELLGRQIVIDLPIRSIIKNGDGRTEVFQECRLAPGSPGS